MTETEPESSALSTIRFPHLVVSRLVPFFQLAATAIPCIDAITQGKTNATDSIFVPIDITGTNITPSTGVLLAGAAYFLDGKFSTLQKTGLGGEEIDTTLKQELNSFIKRKLSKPTPAI